jgi:hypothetical protein
MKKLLAGCALAMLATAASAESRYDRKLEQAVMDIVAGKMGDIRGGLAFNAEKIWIHDKVATASTGLSILGRVTVTDPWTDGLAPAQERHFSGPGVN